MTDQETTNTTEPTATTETNDGLLNLNAANPSTETNNDQSDTTDSPTVDNTDTDTETDANKDTQEATQNEVPAKFINDDGTTNVDALVKSYKELEKGPKLPDVYEDTNFEELGISWGEGESSVAWKEEVNNQFKEAKLSQKQVDVIMPLYSKAIQEMTGQFGPPIDAEFESKKLQEKWGNADSDVYKQNQYNAGEYIKGLNQPELLKYPLHQTAAGMMLLAELAKNKTGPSFVEGDSIKSSTDLKAELSQIITDPAYNSGNAKGKLLQQKADIISQKIANLG